LSFLLFFPCPQGRRPNDRTTKPKFFSGRQTRSTSKVFLFPLGSGRGFISSCHRIRRSTNRSRSWRLEGGVECQGTFFLDRSRKTTKMRVTSSSFSASSSFFRPPLSDASSQEQAGPSERGMRDLDFFFEDLNIGGSELQPQRRHRRKNQHHQQQQRRQIDVESLRGGARVKVSCFFFLLVCVRDFEPSHRAQIEHGLDGIAGAAE